MRIKKKIMAPQITGMKVRGMKKRGEDSGEKKIARISYASAMRDDSGAEIAEAAFVLPLVFILIFGIMWFGRAFNIYTTLNRAAQETAAAAAVSDCATCAANPVNPLDVASSVLRAAHIDPTPLVMAPSSLVPTQLSSGPPPVVGFAVDLSYPYSFKLNGITCCPLTLTPITSGITIHAHAQALQEN